MKTIWKVGLILAVLVVLSGVAAWLFGRPFYHRYKEERFVKQAKAFAAQRDARNAAISARQVLRQNPTNLFAIEMLADIAGALQLPTELDWRRRVVDLAPSLSNQLALVSAAMRREQPPYPLASQAIEEAAKVGSNQVSFHNLAGELALRLKQPERAEAHYRKAAELDPTNLVLRLNATVLRLASTNPATVAEARQTLEGMGGQTNLGAVALSWLVSEAVRRNDLTEAAARSERLVVHPAATMQDRVQHLDLLWRTKNPGVQEYLEKLKTHSSDKATAAFDVSAWMVAHEMAAPALEWLRSLPPKVQTQQPGPTAIVDCLLALQDWQGVQEFLKEPPWGDNMEFLRQAFLARAAWQLKQDVEADTAWRNATREADGRIGSLNALLNLARQWGRTAERVDLLWTINREFARERWTLAELEALYQKAGNTAGLNKVYAAQLTYDSLNFVARNNFAATSLLLDRSPIEAGEALEALRRERPQDPVIASTYAYALHKQGKTQEGLAALEQLPAAQLRLPSVATYYAILLAESGKTNEARPFFTIATNGSLLPEEKKLLSKLPLAPGS